MFLSTVNCSTRMNIHFLDDSLFSKSTLKFHCRLRFLYICFIKLHLTMFDPSNLKTEIILRLKRLLSDQKLHTGLILLDLFKAFDSFHHDILLKKRTNLAWEEILEIC